MGVNYLTMNYAYRRDQPITAQNNSSVSPCDYSAFARVKKERKRHGYSRLDMFRPSTRGLVCKLAFLPCSHDEINDFESLRFW